MRASESSLLLDEPLDASLHVDELDVEEKASASVSSARLMSASENLHLLDEFLEAARFLERASATVPLMSSRSLPSLRALVSVLDCP